MQFPPQTGPSPASSNFAGLLESFTAPEPEADEDETPWPGADLGEDVATFSYENRSRPRQNLRSDLPSKLAAGPVVDSDDRVDESEFLPAPSGVAPAAAAGPDFRKASVTIRLSQTESVRLRRRAAEAGLTVSAYLRSCVLEADALRAQVKQALSELKAGAEGPGKHGNRSALKQESAGQASASPVDQRSGEPKPPRSEGVRLTRALGHIGRLWLGLSSSKSA
jgi:hypothetical protein